MVKIKFGNLRDFNDADMYVGIIPKGLTTKKTLLEAYASVFKFPDYFGFNWDALDEVLSDFSWIKDKNRILIYHIDIPLLDDKDTRILLEILNDRIYDSSTSPIEGFKRSVAVVFPEEYKNKVKKILGEIEIESDSTI
jgi:hypothetical protein